MNRRAGTLVVLIGLAFACGLTPTARADDQVTCESTRRDTVWCPVDTRFGVRLVTQYSRADCRRDDTWGTGSRGIWVSNGCRAQFAVSDGSLRETSSSRHASSGDLAAAAIVGGLIGAAVASDRDRDRGRPTYPNPPSYAPPPAYRPPYRPPPYTLVRCESNRGRNTRCPAGPIGYVEVYDQRSSVACRYGNSWGYDRASIWVAQGCRADFAVYSRW